MPLRNRQWQALIASGAGRQGGTMSGSAGQERHVLGPFSMRGVPRTKAAPSGQSPSGNVGAPLVEWKPREAQAKKNKRAGSVLIAMSNTKREVAKNDLREGPPDSACICLPSELLT